MVEALSSNSSEIFIHLDKKSNDKEYLSIRDCNVHFTKDRVPVFWGDFSLVEATLVLLETVFSAKTKFDRFVLLSGSDYPLRRAADIEIFFHNNKDTEYINLVEMPSEAMGKPISRLTNYKLRPRDGRALNAAKSLLIKAGILPRKRDYKKYLTDLIPYGGSTWWAITREAAEYILCFTHERRQVLNFFKNTIFPDEMLFQTILGNSDFRARIKGNLTYADWSAGGPHPANISERHIAIFKTTSSFPVNDAFGEREILFARKFPDDSDQLVSVIRNQIW